ncbi:rusA-like resolvase [Rhodococcus phage Reynauld]|uniref:RusA-like resolvase n=1 Tax=Rhodococcus phage Reynauld TaxID=3062845 RepID=A0ACD4UJI3_9CAUD|nr:rusA-like resolvase [Rhodococcus phage Reynauld]
MADRVLYVIPVNPEPWKMPPLSVARAKKPYVQVGRDDASHAYQEAIRAHLRNVGAEKVDGEFHRVHFLFSRRRERYQTQTGRNMTRSVADATNMQKLTEDALQDILFKNDKNNRWVTSQTIAQDTECDGFIVIMVAPMLDPDVIRVPEGFTLGEIEEAISADAVPVVTPVSSNGWGDGTVDF